MENPLYRVVKRGKTQVWYQRNFGWWYRDQDSLDPDHIEKTHALVGEIAITKDKIGDIFPLMQGENWSPKGEANKFVRLLGVHTSMSVGDIVVFEDKSMFVCDTSGWKEIGKNSSEA